jgi:D-amino-acid oxidase
MHGDVDVTIIAEGFFEQTTSYGCGGWWEPYLITGGEEKIHKWGKATFEHYVSLHHSADARRAGIQIQNKTDLQQEGEEKHSEPFWKDIVFNYQAFDREGVARRGFSDRFVGGHSFTAMVADQKYYLKYLMDKLEFWGVKFEQRKVHTLSSLAGEFDVVINCAGLGSRDLVEDSETYPVKGHVVRVM